MRIEDIALTFVQGLGIKGTAHLLDLMGSATDIFAASERELTGDAELREDIARNIASRKSFSAAEKELKYCSSNGITPIASTDADYPQLLLQTDDYPHIIYVKGNIDVLSTRMVAMVGTRKMTPYGERVCNEIVQGLAAQLPDAAVVSGLAFGIDSAAHRAALAYGMRTVAVVANPLPDVTPVQHTALAQDIVDKGGAVITELSSQTKQNGNYYIPRNRIVAGMTAGTIVVESGLGGGSLSTAQFADGYSRSVMAVPGRITDSMSKGCNALIRNRKAQTVLSADDVIDELMWELGEGDKRKRDLPTFELSDEQRGILGCFRTDDAIGLDALADVACMSVSEMSAALLDLELMGVVRQLPGKMYEKLI